MTVCRLKAALDGDHYPLPPPAGIFTNLSGGTPFAKLDLSEAYFQVEVAPEPRKPIAVEFHHGLYQCIQLLFDVKTAPIIFQYVVNIVLSDLPGMSADFDEIMIRTTS